jgi:hypothetical protein
MPKVSKETASDRVTMEGFEGRYQDLGEFTIGFEYYSQDVDLSDLFTGLPQDACQCRHMGVVLRGQVVFTYADGTEDVVVAGEAYVTRTGHTPRISAGTEVIEFSSTADLSETLEVLTKNIRAFG